MGDFLKEVPHAPQELSKKRNRSTDGKNSPISVWERTALFRRYYRKLRAPPPLSLHDIRLSLWRAHRDALLVSLGIHLFRKWTPFPPLRDSKNSLPYLFSFGLPNENAKFESLTIRKNIGDAERQQFLRCQGVPRGNVLASFFRHFLGRAKKWHQKTAQLSARRRRAV